MIRFAVRCRLLLLGALVSLGAAPPGVPGAGRSPVAQGGDSALVVVTRDEVRVTFPRDGARTWGWPASPSPHEAPYYFWGATVDGIDGPRTLMLGVYATPQRARTFRSLAQLIAAGRASICSPGMIAVCSDSGVQAAERDGHLVLTLRDSVAISRLFGLRPAAVQTHTHRPEHGTRTISLEIPVVYAAPEIPVPDDAFRAAAARSRRRYEESIRQISRYIGGDRAVSSQPVWLVAGDSTFLDVREMHCQHDVCHSGAGAFPDARWDVVDTSVAVIRGHSAERSAVLARINPGPTMKLIGRRPGSTKLIVSGLRGMSDTMPSRVAPASTVEREVIVTRPVARIAIAPRPTRVRANEGIAIRVLAYDETGAMVGGLPVELVRVEGEQRMSWYGSGTLTVSFASQGRARLIARLGSHADTVEVIVSGRRGR